MHLKKTEIIMAANLLLDDLDFGQRSPFALDGVISYKLIHNNDLDKSALISFMPERTAMTVFSSHVEMVDLFPSPWGGKPGIWTDCETWAFDITSGQFVKEF